MEDMTETLAAKSDQMNAIDLVGGPITVTVTRAKVSGGEQPVSIWTAELGEGRPYKPGLSMRRVIVKAWGADSSTYAGKRMTLFNDPTVKWAGEAVGGLRISHLSHIDKPLDISLPVTKGKAKNHHVDPLPTAPTPKPSIPPISDDDAVDLTRSITEAVTVTDLDEIARDLKALNLGEHRGALMAAWNKRKTAIEAEAAK